MTGITRKPHLSLLQIVEMNLGFLGLQFSFGLQQSNMGPIYSYLGADEASLPLLSLAGPMTGLLVQPIIGAMSDRTLSRFGRRTPYFLIGAVLCSLALFAMPYSPALWVAASLLWILDAANNITMEPYRAYVSDRLDPDQHAHGFLIQSAFTGAAQTLSYLAPTALVMLGISRDAMDANHIPIITRVAFVIGAVLSFSTIVWSVWRVRELPLDAASIAVIRSKSHTFRSSLLEIRAAIIEMPQAMRQMAVMKLFQWYAMGIYWSYATYAIARSLYATRDPGTAAFREAVLTSGQAGGFYNFVAFAAVVLLVPATRRFGARPVHALCLLAGGLAMLWIPQITSKALLFVPMIGMGLAWGSIMGNPYIMLAGCIPPERTGVYMGIFNMFIVVPMIINGLTVPLMYHRLLGGDPRNVLWLGGVLMICGAAATLRVKVPARIPT